MASPRCAGCGRFVQKKANFCSACGTSMTGKLALAKAVNEAFSEESRSILTELDLLEATEVVSVIRRPDDDLIVDFGELDNDTTISLLAKGLFMSIIGELGMRPPFDEIFDDEEDEE